jgi:uncharacterized protein YjdB
MMTPMTATVKSGETQQFAATFSPVPPDTKVVWTVTDAITASIDQNGKLTAKSPGKTTVRANPADQREYAGCGAGDAVTDVERSTAF